MSHPCTIRDIALSTFCELQLQEEYQSQFLEVIGDSVLNQALATISTYDFDDDMTKLVIAQEKSNQFNGQQKNLVLFLNTFANKVYYSN